MTPEAQRIAIAEACGWSVWDFKGSAGDEVWWSHPNGVSKLRDNPPDYLSDLNAMHEAVDKVLIGAGKNGDWRGWNSYVLVLSEMVGAEGAIEASAAQRAEAFLRTLNLYNP